MSRKQIAAACREDIRDYADKINRYQQRIYDLAYENVEGFEQLYHEVSKIWSCNESPIGMCVYNLDETCCIYCDKTKERK